MISVIDIESREVQQSSPNTPKKWGAGVRVGKSLIPYDKMFVRGV